jgi:hypothetical protein
MRAGHGWAVRTLAASAAVTLIAPAAAAEAAPARPGLAGGSVSPAAITGGDAAVQTIRLTRPAPAGGLDVWVTASDVVYTASAGSAVHVPAGATSVSFPFRLAAPPATEVRALWAQVQGSPLTKVADVTVRAADPGTRAVRALRFDRATAVAGSSVTGTVTLAAAAPAGGISVALWSNTSYGPNVYVPPYVVVGAGRTSATFEAYVTSADAPAVVRPSADLGTSRATASLAVAPAPAPGG